MFLNYDFKGMVEGTINSKCELLIQYNETLTEIDIEYLAVRLKYNTSIAILSLDSCHINSATLNLLMVILRDLKSIQSFNYHANDNSNTVAIAKILIPGVMANPAIKSLALSGNIFDEMMMKSLVSAITHNTTMESLSLRYKNLTQKNIIPLFNALRANSKLKNISIFNISLDVNDIQKMDCLFDEIAFLLTVNSSLTTINFGDELESANLLISEATAVNLFKALANNVCLKNIILPKFCVTSNVKNELINSFLINTTIIELNLNLILNDESETDDLSAILQAIASSPSLSSLALMVTLKNRASIDMLFDFMRANQSLCTLKVCVRTDAAMGIDEESVGKLRTNFLKFNVVFEVFNSKENLIDCRVGDRGANRYQQKILISYGTEGYNKCSLLKSQVDDIKSIKNQQKRLDRIQNIANEIYKFQGIIFWRISYYNNYYSGYNYVIDTYNQMEADLNVILAEEYYHQNDLAGLASHLRDQSLENIPLDIMLAHGAAVNIGSNSSGSFEIKNLTYAIAILQGHTLDKAANESLHYFAKILLGAHKKIPDFNISGTSLINTASLKNEKIIFVSHKQLTTLVLANLNHSEIICFELVELLRTLIFDKAEKRRSIKNYIVTTHSFAILRKKLGIKNLDLPLDPSALMEMYISNNELLVALREIINLWTEISGLLMYLSPDEILQLATIEPLKSELEENFATTNIIYTNHLCTNLNDFPVNVPSTQVINPLKFLAELIKTAKARKAVVVPHQEHLYRADIFEVLKADFIAEQTFMQTKPSHQDTVAILGGLLNDDAVTKNIPPRQTLFLKEIQAAFQEDEINFDHIKCIALNAISHKPRKSGLFYKPHASHLIFLAIAESKNLSSIESHPRLLELQQLVAKQKYISPVACK